MYSCMYVMHLYVLCVEKMQQSVRLKEASTEKKAEQSNKRLVGFFPSSLTRLSDQTLGRGNFLSENDADPNSSPPQTAGELFSWVNCGAFLLLFQWKMMPTVALDRHSR